MGIMNNNMVYNNRVAGSGTHPTAEKSNWRVANHLTGATIL